jgi:hypothetical protein
MKDKPDNKEMTKLMILEIMYAKMFMKNVGGEDDVPHIPNRPRI